jgi:hypothetical protein
MISKPPTSVVLVNSVNVVTGRSPGREWNDARRLRPFVTSASCQAPLRALCAAALLLAPAILRQYTQIGADLLGDKSNHRCRRRLTRKDRPTDSSCRGPRFSAVDVDPDPAVRQLTDATTPAALLTQPGVARVAMRSLAMVAASSGHVGRRLPSAPPRHAPSNRRALARSCDFVRACRTRTRYLPFSNCRYQIAAACELQAAS